MKKSIKKYYNFIRRLPIMIIVMIMTLSIIGDMVASNFIVEATKYFYAEQKIVTIENKAEHGRVISLKHGYMEHWNDELRSQYEKANEAFKEVVAYSDTAKWINRESKTDIGVFRILLAIVVSFIAICICTKAVYASFLALIKKACEHEERKIEQYKNRRRTIRIIQG